MLIYILSHTIVYYYKLGAANNKYTLLVSTWNANQYSNVYIIIGNYEASPSRMKPEETLVEIRSDSNVQIDRPTWA